MIEVLKVEVVVEKVVVDVVKLKSVEIELSKDFLVVEIEFDDFVKVDLWIVKIFFCEVVEKLDKLFKFEFDIGGEIC